MVVLKEKWKIWKVKNREMAQFDGFSMPTSHIPKHSEFVCFRIVCFHVIIDRKLKLSIIRIRLQVAANVVVADDNVQPQFVQISFDWVFVPNIWTLWTLFRRLLFVYLPFFSIYWFFGYYFWRFFSIVIYCHGNAKHIRINRLRKKKIIYLVLCSNVSHR